MYLPAPDESVWVGVARIVLSVPGSRSLKDKRRAVHQVRDRLRSRRNVSVAEVGHLEDRSRAVMVIAMVGNDARFVQGALDSIVHEIGEWRVGLIESASVRLWRPTDGGETPGFEDLDA
ncbi:MAG: DUF503 domain-containing protein [Deltaproteobacteria bacterium]|nr:MAG: DUF503 domain-containing protein [Deltaproteobacteria bacterium]